MLVRGNDALCDFSGVKDKNEGSLGMRCVVVCHLFSGRGSDPIVRGCPNWKEIKSSKGVNKIMEDGLSFSVENRKTMHASLVGY